MISRWSQKRPEMLIRQCKAQKCNFLVYFSLWSHNFCWRCWSLVCCFAKALSVVETSDSAAFTSNLPPQRKLAGLCGGGTHIIQITVWHIQLFYCSLLKDRLAATAWRGLQWPKSWAGRSFSHCGSLAIVVTSLCRKPLQGVNEWETDFTDRYITTLSAEIRNIRLETLLSIQERCKLCSALFFHIDWLLIVQPDQHHYHHH